MAADSTGVIRSNSLSVYISTTAGAITSADPPAIDNAAYWDLVANSTSGEISLTRNAIEVSDKGSKGREHLLDFLDWSVTVEAQVRYDGTMPANGTIRNADAMQALFAAGTRVAVAWTTGAQTDSPAASDPVVFGYAYITEYSESAGLNDVATVSMTFTGDGLVTIGDVGDSDKFQVPSA
mgnify:CR=1 FL=1|jgi:TP901-1 family phage major tail protein|tara:strand:- start:326 stop:865 length:540 start_codon:yes stop_codon:yes gene_type:complete